MSDTDDCGFVQFSSTKCGLNRDYPNETSKILLKACKKDIKGHLESNHIRRGDVKTEWELIAFRCGLFDTNTPLLDTKLICPAHRYRLGVRWRCPRSCQHPLHGTKKTKPYRNINLITSRQIFLTWNVLVSIGSGICRICKELHLAEIKKQQEQCSSIASSAATSVQKPVDEGSCSVSVTSGKSKATDPPMQHDDDDQPTTMDITPETSSGEDIVLPTAGLSEISQSSESESLPSSPRQLDKSYAPTPAPRNLTLASLNSFMRQGNYSEVTGQLLKPMAESKPSTVRYYKRKAQEGFNLVLHCLAPGQEDELMQIVQKGVVESSSDEDVTDSLVKCYHESSSSHTKRQILSILACNKTKQELQKLIPGLTVYRIDMARKHAIQVGQGQPVEIAPIQRNRMEEVKIDHFIDFVSRPEFVQDVAYGTKTMKLSHEEKLTIPNVVRTVVVSRIIDLYIAYCEETSFELLGKSLLFSIIQVCAASGQRSLAGLDNIAADGADAFVTLHSITVTVGELGFPAGWVSEMKGRIQDAKNYLKTDFKLNIDVNSTCANHCMMYALSDGRYCQHEHSTTCSRCNDVHQILVDLEEALGASTVKFRYKQQKQELAYDLQSAKESIERLQSHIVRKKNQERSKSDVLEELGPYETHITMDWAMKFLPNKFRESQQDWFGKKGISWHVTAAVTKSAEDTFEIHCFVHLVDQCTQNWFAVLSVLEASMMEIKKRLPHIDSAYLRSDNAGCYHCAPLILAIPSLSEQTGITVKQYNFSEAQAGKDLCDRKIAPMKSHMQRYVNEGHDVTSADEMWMALSSYGGIRGCYAAVVKLDDQSMTERVKWPGVTTYTDFTFAGEWIHVWRAYKVGPGEQLNMKTLLKSTIPQKSTNAKVSKYTIPRTATGTMAQSALSSVVEIHCTDSACVKTFCSQELLTHHLSHGKHQYRPITETKMDLVARKWAGKLTDVRPGTVSATTSGSLQYQAGVQSNIIEPGWALKESRTRRRFSEPVKNFLLDEFMRGVETGKKEVPANVAKKLKTRFAKEEWLTAQQIASYFSRLAAQQKSGLPFPQSTVAAEDEDAVSEVMYRRHLRSRIIEQCEL
ncbi:hypothetical protein SNE40_017244 [Patella caerulea]|uniref:C2H2-type domain-containing protein n=1 Tax=Patella caerulea TaxID=87958 RepID=A0AAN8PL64_PATCE